MKKAMITFLILLVAGSQIIAGAEEQSGNKFFLSVNANYLSPSDSFYKEVYGSSAIYPGVIAGFKIIKDIYIFLGYDTLKKTGTTPVLEENAESTQNMISFGAGYEGSLSEKFGFRIEAGGVSFAYKEEALGESVDGSKIGLLLRGGFVYNLGEKLFLSLLTGVTSASDNVEGIKIKLGGFFSSIGIGLRF